MAVMNAQDALSFNPTGAHISNNSLSSAVTITIPEGATKIAVQAITQNIRMTLGGTTPTTILGFRITQGNDPMVIPIGEGTALKFIEETATAVLQYQFGY